MDAFTQTDAVVLELPPDPKAIALARLFVGTVARDHGIDEDLIDDLKIATSETVTNAVKAHLSEDVRERVRIVAHAGERELTIEIVDRGPGFDIPPPPTDAVTPPAGLFEGSLGLTVVRSLFPDVVIARNAERGMTVRFSAPVRGD